MRKTWILLCLVLLAATAAGYGQTGLGTIAGKVTDTSGGVVPGAEVIATNVGTGVKTQAITNDVGGYLVPNLIPGKYALAVSMSGFKTLQREAITVQVGDRITLDFTLEIGEVSQTVNVTGEAPLLRRRDSETGEVVTHTMIQNLPQLNRDPLQLLILSGNVQGTGERAGGRGDESDLRNQDTRINGGRNLSVEYLVDGISMLTGRAHTIGAIAPSMDGVGEFRVITNPVAAEYGRVSGGVVQFITRSGTNDFHGQVFDYNQNTVFNANSWEQNRQGKKRPVFNQNVFGAAVGGPVVLPKIYDGHNKTFFFFNYDGTRYVNAGEVQSASVPTEAMRAGDFTGVNYGGVPTMLYEPTTLDEQRFDNGWFRTKLLGGDGKHVPANRVNPVSAALLKLLPLPNRAPEALCSYCGNYTGLRNTKRNSDGFAVRLDHSLTDKQSLFGRFNRSSYVQAQTSWMGIMQPAPSTRLEGQWGLTLNYIYSISSTTIVDARVGGHYNPLRTGSSMDPAFDNSGLSLPDVTRNLLNNPNSLLAIYVAGSNNPAPGFPGWGGDSFRYNPSTAFEAAGSLSKILNRHTVKVGYEHRRWYDNQYQSAGGRYHVLGNATTESIDTNEWSSQGMANAWGTFLLGISGWNTLTGYTTRALNMNYHAGYIMDDFRVNSRLTLNLGLRWEMETPTTDRFDNLLVWDPDLAPPFQLRPGFDWNAMVDQLFPTGSDATDQAKADNKALKAAAPSWVKNGFPNGGNAYVNTPEHPSRKAGSYHPYQFAPRFGLAYSLNDKTVLRASFAKVYLPTTGDPNAFLQSADNFTTSAGAQGPWADSDPNYATKRYWTATFTDPWPYPGEVTGFERTTAAANKKSTRQPSLGTVDKNLHQSYELAWNVGLQRELPAGLLVEAIYSANRGVGLLGREMVSRVPKEIMTGGLGGDNNRRYSSTVVNPWVPGQTNLAPDEVMHLGSLLTQYPYFGTVAVAGRNIGTSVYHSLNLRSEKRFSRGVSFLFNYTLSNLKDDVGGPGNNDRNAKNSTGGGKWVQSVDSTKDVWGTSMWDEKHRISTTFDFQLPFGRNRRWLSNSNAVLNGVVGGWILAGNALWRSGRPIVWPQDNNMNTKINAIEITAASWADPADQNLRNRSITSWDQVFVSPSVTPRFNGGILDISKLYYNATNHSWGYKQYGYGDMVMYDGVRNPGSTMFNFSLMKRFPILSGDGTRYLQFRMEAQNAFNMRGYGNIQIDPRSPAFFGYINGAQYQPRNIQMSMQFVF